MKIRLNRCDYFVIMCCLYSLQGVLYKQGLINQLFQALIILWAFFESFPYIMGNASNDKFIRIVRVLILFFSAYGILYLFTLDPVVFDVGGSVASYYYLQTFLNSLLPILLFYKYTKMGYLTESRLTQYFVLFYVITIPQYFLNYNINLLTNQYGQTEFTNNMGYKFLSLFPLVCFLYKKPVVQYLCSGAIVLFLLMSMKRGSIVIGAVCLMVFIFQNMRKQNQTKNRSYTVILTCAIVGFVFYYVSYMLENSDLFLVRINKTLEGDSSGRDVLQKTVWDTFWDKASVFEYFFGFGANSTIRFAGNYAHQDWLEVLCNNGLLGVLLMAIFYIRLFKTRKLLKSDVACYNALLILFIICISRSLFSMSINSLDISISCCMGYLVYRATEINDSRSVL